MYWLPTFKGVAHQRSYGIGSIFKGLTRMFAPVVKKGLLNLGKHVVQSRVQVLDDVSQREDAKVVSRVVQ